MNSYDRCWGELLIKTKDAEYSNVWRKWYDQSNAVAELCQFGAAKIEAKEFDVLLIRCMSNEREQFIEYMTTHLPHIPYQIESAL